MKYLLKNTLILLLVSLTFCCSQEEDFSSLENQKLDAETFFKKVASMHLEISQELVIYIDYQWDWDPVEKTIEYVHSEEKEPDFFILESPKETAQNNGFVSNEYQVHCDHGGHSWSEEWGGKWSCGKSIARCLDEGGCTTICQQRMVYVPQATVFYVSVN